MCVINRQTHVPWIICCVLLTVLLAACRREAASGPLVQATLTPTPRSTPLPPVPTVVLPGVEENPIQMVIRPSGNVNVARRLITDAQISAFENAILEETGLVVRVTLVDRYAEALAALCDSTPTRVTVAWLDGLTYQVAMAQNCGTPAMQIERDRQAGDAGQIVTTLDVSSAAGLQGRGFCRLGYDDYYSWLVPSLLLESSGVDSISGLETITDYDDVNSLMEAVAAGECDAAGISETALEELDDLRDDLNVIASTPPLPYGVLMYPMNLPLGERLRLTDGLIALDRDSDSAEALKPLLNQDRLRRVDAEDFDELSEFLAGTGLDFAQLGR